MRTWHIVVGTLAVSAIAIGVMASLLVNNRDRQPAPLQTYPSPANGRVPLGDTAGAGFIAPASLEQNPLAQDPQAVAAGRRLYMSMNCAGCHGYDGTGGMGPDLTDDYWRYGGMPAQVYASILEGRPEGMPRWGLALPRESIWQLVSYLQSLGGTFPAQVNPTDRNRLNRGQHKGANQQR
jgi:cytochrome c oxidase cbb3-type subunit 3